MNPELSFWGVRGSFPAALPSCRLLGGNTACLQVEWQGHQLILDAGSGIRKLGQHLLSQDSEQPIHLLLSHPHWDHLQGFPFFAPAYLESTRLHVHSIKRQVTMKELLTAQQESTFFPVPLEGLACELHFHEWEEGERFSLGPFLIETWRLNHPGVCSGWRIHAGEFVIAYVSDVAPSSDHLLADPLPGNLTRQQSLLRLYENQLRLAENADIVIYDTCFTQEQYAERSHWGHSTLSQALEVCERCKVPLLFTFHHNAEIDDQVQMARAQQASQPSLEVRAGQEGQRYSLVKQQQCA